VPGAAGWWAVAMRADRSERGPGVLVVEDNKLIRALEIDVLRGLGYDATAVETAEHAMALLDDPRIALLLTDIRLPGGLDGIGLARAAKRRRPDLQIMLLGADLNHLAPEDLHGIADDSLSKPFTVDELEERVVRLAKRRDTPAT